MTTADGVGQIGWVTTTQSHAHEVVEAVTLEGTLQGHLVDNHVLDQRNLEGDSIGTTCQRHGRLWNLIERVALGTSAATRVDALGILYREVVAIEVDKGGTQNTLGIINQIVDNIGIEAILQHGKGCLRESGTVEGLGIAQVDHADAVERHTVTVELVDGLYFIRGTRIAFGLRHAIGVISAETEVANQLRSLQVLLGGIDGVLRTVGLDVDTAVVGSSRQLAHTLCGGSLGIVHVDARGAEDVLQVAPDTVKAAALHRDVADALIVSPTVGERAADDTVVLGTDVGPGSTRKTCRQGCGVRREVVVIVLGSLGVAPGPQAKITQQSPHGDEELLGVLLVDLSVDGQLGVDVRLDVVDEIVAYFVNADKALIQGILSVHLGEQRLGDQGNVAIDQSHLQVSPGTESLDDGILSLEHLAVVLHQVLVDVLQVIVAVVDDCIVVADAVVGIVRVHREVGDGLQVLAGRGCGGGQVAAQFAEQHGTVGNGLHLVDDAHDAVDAVGRFLQAVVLQLLHQLGVGVHDIGT